MGTRGGRARIAGCRRLTSSIEHAAKLGRPPLLNPSCPPVSSDAEHVKKHELIRARLADRSKAETELTNHARLKKDIENSLRGSLKVFGLRLGQVTKRTFEARILELVDGRPS